MADRAAPLRAQVISVVSHELRTPLTSIKSLIGMVEDGNLRAVSPALARLFPDLEEFARVPVTNSRGEEVGEVVRA